jgi:hypothetical protein
MARFRGVVGYSAGEVEVKPGVTRENIIERTYRGDVVRNTRQLREGEKVNDDLTVGNSISIVADAYAREHFHAMRYIRWAGTLWKVDDVTEERPRLLLRLGGVYNGNTPGA